MGGRRQGGREEGGRRKGGREGRKIMMEKGEKKEHIEDEKVEERDRRGERWQRGREGEEHNSGRREMVEKNKEEGVRKRVRSWRIVQKRKNGQGYGERWASGERGRGGSK